jgi:ABC-2 type transport system permease protein
MNPLDTRFVRTAWALFWRQTRVLIAKPSLIVPMMLMPIFFFTAFAGGLSAVGSAPDFNYPDYTTFQFVFVLMQSAVFGAVFTGFSIAADFESGFARRLLLAAHGRSALIAGYWLTSVFRALLTWTVVTVVAVVAGASFNVNVGDVLSLLLMAVLLNGAALLFATGMAMRLRTLQGAPMIQLPAFLLIMTSPVYVPRDLIEGWVGTVADFNPLTALLEAGRELAIGGPADLLLAFGVVGGLIAVMVTWAVTGLRRAERAPA